MYLRWRDIKYGAVVVDWVIKEVRKTKKPVRITRNNSGEGKSTQKIVAKMGYDDY
jgi:hypothetical protein